VAIAAAHLHSLFEVDAAQDDMNKHMSDVVDEVTKKAPAVPPWSLLTQVCRAIPLVRWLCILMHLRCSVGTCGLRRRHKALSVCAQVSLYNNNLNGILADEMGLGKTVQVCYHHHSVSHHLSVLRCHGVSITC
jgi:SNF2 family DNA or RNA helicase